MREQERESFLFFLVVETQLTHLALETEVSPQGPEAFIVAGICRKERRRQQLLVFEKLFGFCADTSG